MGKFGWSYPPGAASDPGAPWNQEEGPCAVCGSAVDHCICPVCPVCGAQGDPACYDALEGRGAHGTPLTRTQEQVLSLAWEEAHAEAACRDEAAYWAAHPGADEF